MRTVRDRNGETHLVDDANYLLDGVLVKIDLSAVIALDLEGFLDQISEDAGFPLLMAQSYEIEGHEGDTLLLRVRGDVSMELDATEDD